MIIDFDANDGEWFPFFMSRINAKTGDIEYDEPLPDAGRVCIRSLTPFLEQRQTSRKKKAEFVLNPKTRSMERVEYIEELPPDQAKAERDDAWDYIIKDFNNFFDAKGEPIPCNRENKLRLMTLPVFDRFVARCIQLLSEQVVKTAEEERKNG